MLLKIIFVFSIMTFFSCVPLQNQVQNGETNSPEELKAQQIVGDEMMAAGYLPGRIIYSDEGDDCQYTIQLKDGEKDFYYVDPINLEKKFNTDGQTVWLKFTTLEREKRCEKAIPVEIVEIQNRDE